MKLKREYFLSACVRNAKWLLKEVTRS